MIQNILSFLTHLLIRSAFTVQFCEIAWTRVHKALLMVYATMSLHALNATMCSE